MVQGRPFLILGGETHNSSTSNLDYIAPVWPRLARMHLNTVLAPVSWEQMEPTEGSFDWSLVDGLIAGARASHLHLVLLWFGTWKNMVSSYAPEWIRTDPRRFPLTVDDAGNWLPVPSTFGAHTRDADARAFGMLMRHLKTIDSVEQTVVMVQVENEVGIPDSSRDHSEAAESAFKEPVPEQVKEALLHHRDDLTWEMRAAWEAAGERSSGNWADVFGLGPVANELFMAWHYATYVESVASAGKAEYPIPLFVNAAIGRKDGKIGSYPGGGALPLAINIWRLAAPSIDLLSPDIYYGSFAGWCEKYVQSGNPLFIPETNGGRVGAANAFLAIGRWNAIGFSPFAIEDHDATGDEFSRAYGVLGQLAPLILDHQRDGSMNAVVLNSDAPEQTFTLGNYGLHICLRREDKSAVVTDHGYALAIEVERDRFLVAGEDVEVTFKEIGTSHRVVELGKVVEGQFEGDRWVPGRRLNGDEVMLDYHLSTLAAGNETGTGLRLRDGGPSILEVSVFKREAKHP